TRNQKPETRNPKPETRNQKPETKKMDLLEKIVNAKRKEIAETRKSRTVAELQSMIADSPRPRSLPEAILNNPPGIIAEIKRRSPSAGEIQEGLDRDGVADLAGRYAAGGAAAISVLTETQFFGGSPKDLAAVKKETRLPVLMKDFILDEYQLLFARAIGADSILLIARILEDSRLRMLLERGRELDFEPLVEVHNREELARAIKAGAVLIGINNRDLQTLKTDLAVTRSLLPEIPRDRVAVSESGIRTREEIEVLWGLGARGFLIGESLLKAGDPAKKLRELTGKTPVSR
ncbi:MAG: indole-3-glycerol phosphate synthase TrpC, partial [bacterium]|nr:indole-3-glycerol phosphate synthase TrpC [bacterium]